MPTVFRASTSPEYTAALARGLASVLHDGDVVTLRGELGSGKTTFVRALAHALSVDPAVVASPTFVLVHRYPRGRHDRFLVHVDAYRLRGEEELANLGWDRIMSPDAFPRAAPGTIAVVEWPERIAGALPLPGDGSPHLVAVTLDHAGETCRNITIELPDEWSSRPGTAMLLEREPILCPVTGEWVEPTRLTYPFAHDKARLADLNRWFDGQYRISRPAREDDTP